MRRRPYVWIDIQAVLGDHHGRGRLFALSSRQLPVRHGCEPNVRIEADLMAGMARAHGAAARLRHVANEQPAPMGLRRLIGEALEETHEVGMAPITVAREPHDLPSLAIDRQGLSTGKTALGVGAYG